MKLRGKFILSHLLVGILPLLLMGNYANFWLKKENFQSVSDYFTAQLIQIDFNLSNFLKEVSYDVENLAATRIVRSREDKTFTNFVDTDENTFIYNIGTREQQIIELFATYRKTHPYSNSVYMGRETGSFVRSHPRARPTQYDPRERPWYQLGADNPDRVMRTAPYRSVTTDDINIGTVKALLDENGELLGVIGVDITLTNLTDVISRLQLGKNSYIFIIDDRGIILSNPDKERLFKSYDKAGLNSFDNIMKKDSGYLIFEDRGRENIVFFHTSPILGWKICAVVPLGVIEKEINPFTSAFIALFGLVLVTVFFNILYFSKQTISPMDTLLKRITKLSIQIRERKEFEKLPVIGQDEISDMAAAFNNMGQELFDAYFMLKEQSLNLENTVSQRTEALRSANIKLADKASDLEDAIEIARDANLVKSDFLANMSHEIRTPMNAIMGFTELLYMTEDDSDKKSKLEIIKTSGENLLVLINDILDFSKIEAGKVDLERISFNLEVTLDHLYSMYKSKANDKGLYFNISIDKLVPRVVSGDKHRINQVLTNIIGNAIKFTKKGGIRVDCNYSDGMVTIKVSDTGIGIPDNKLETIFSSFSQVDSSTEREFGGTGLGLTISRRLAVLMGGSLTAVRKKEGTGSTFILKLPLPKVKEANEDFRRLLTAENRLKKDEKYNGIINTFSNYRILLAEDNKTNQTLIEAILESMNLKCDIAENGKIALNKLSMDHYDILLLDIQMPVMDGLETIKHIRNDKTLNNLPVIALTANAMAGDAEKYIKAGCNDYLSKPIDPKKLLEMLEKYRRDGLRSAPTD